MKIQLRQSLLASAALSALVLAGTAAPRSALAACAGSPNFICTNNDADGISDAGGTIFTSGSITMDPATTGSSSDTLNINLFGAAGSNNFNFAMTNSFSIISGIPANGHGLDIFAVNGGGTHNYGTIAAPIAGQINGVSGNGINVLLAQGGTVNMVLGSTALVTGSGTSDALGSPTAGGGVVINSLSGTANISVINHGTFRTQNDGIFLGQVSGSGAFSITNDGSLGTEALPLGGSGAVIVGAPILTSSTGTINNDNGTIWAAGNGGATGDFGGAAVVVGGNAEVTNLSGNIQTVDDAGILAVSFGTGTAVVDSRTDGTEDALNGTVTSTNGPGIVAISLASTATVDAGVVNSGANAVSIGGVAIPALPVIPFLPPITLSGGVLALASGDAIANAHGDITTTGQFGVLAFSATGNATASSDAGILVDPPIGMAAITVGDNLSSVPNNGAIQSTVVGLLGVNIGDGSVQITNSQTGEVDADTGTGVLVLKIGPGATTTLPGGYSVIVSNDNADGGDGGRITALNGGAVSIIAGDLIAGPASNVLVSNTNGAQMTGEGGLLTSTVGVLTDGDVQITNDTNAQMNTDTVGNVGLALGVLAGGDVTVDNNNSADIFGTAALATLGGDTTFNNDNSATWISSGLNVLAATGDTTINNNNNAVITMAGLPAVNIMAAGNNVTINNDNGAVFTLQGLTGNFMFAGNNAEINNNNGAILNFEGLNGNLMVGDNDTIINNENGAVINLTGINFLGFIPDANFGGVGDSAVNNSSIINVTGFTTFQGLEDFNNADGLLNMANFTSDYGLANAPAPYGNGIGDVTQTDGNFNGGGTSSLGIDAFLRGPGADSSSDLLLVGEFDTGDVTGATALLVNDLNPGAGAYNPTGILFAHVEGDAPEGSFFLPGGPIDKGFFSYDILRVETASSDWLLVSAPNDRAAELPALITGAQTIWYESTGVWLDRTADLRRQVTNCSALDDEQMAAARVGDTQITPTADVVAPECHYKRMGFWFRGYGGEYDRDSSNVEYDQSLFGGEAGLDVVLSDDPSSGAFILGVLGGYLTSKMDFDSTGDDAKFDGATVGAYATYLNGGWYADLLFKANILDVDYETTFDDPENDASTDAVSLGARLDTGYRFDTDGGFFIEPQATLAYVSTELDDFTLLGTDVDPDDADSLRGRLGLRIGGSWDNGSMIFEPFLVGSVWHEFEGDNEVTLTNGGTIAVSDEIDNTYGEVGGGLNVIDASGGLSLFAKVDALVGGDIESISGKVGGRIAW